MAIFQEVASGYFTSDGSVHEVPMRSDFDSFEVINQTQAATTQATGRGVEFEWRKGFASDSAVMITKQNASNALDMEFVTSGGFLRVDESNQVLGAEQSMSGTEITQANPAVVTVTAHGYSNGDRVRIYGTTGMLQVGGYDFTIGSVATNSFELSYLDSSGFAAAATAGSVRKVPNDPMFAPRENRVTAMSAASAMVVTFAVTHNLVVGQKIRLHVSSDFGMVEADALLGEITAVSTANNTVTLDIDSSAFTAFAFPTSAVASAGVSPAHAVPVSEIAAVLSNPTLNEAQILMKLAGGADSPGGSTGDIMYWKALASNLRIEE